MNFLLPQPWQLNAVRGSLVRLTRKGWIQSDKEDHQRPDLESEEGQYILTKADFLPFLIADAHSRLLSVLHSPSSLCFLGAKSSA